MLKIHAVPTLREPVLLCAFTGWSDGAFAATGALQYLSTQHAVQPIAEFDPDQVYSYTVTRPLTALSGPGQRVLRWPLMEWTALRMPEAPHDLVLLRGPEPDLRWQACVEEAAGFASRLGITQVLGLGAFYAQVPYSGPAFLMGLSANPALRVRLTMLGVRESGYEGPTGFLTALVDGTHKAGIPSAAIWAAAPNYLPATSNPRLAAALLAIAERLLGQPLERGELEQAGRELEEKINEALRSRPDLAKFVKGLGGSVPAPSETPPAPARGQPAEPEELPSAEEVLRDLEEHLRRQRRQPPEGQ